MAVLSTLKHHGSYDRTCLIYDNLCLYITDKKSWNTWCQRPLINCPSPLPHYNVGRNSNGKQTTLHGVGGGGGVNLSLSVSTILSKIV